MLFFPCVITATSQSFFFPSMVIFFWRYNGHNIAAQSPVNTQYVIHKRSNRGKKILLLNKKSNKKSSSNATCIRFIWDRILSDIFAADDVALPSLTRKKDNEITAFSWLQRLHHCSNANSTIKVSIAIFTSWRLFRLC